MKTIISKRFEFSAAHKLPWHLGKCKRLHGHNYILTVFLKGELDKNGIVMDYYDVSQIVKSEIIEKFDHYNLNDFFPNTTAEVLAYHFLQTLKEKDKRFFKVILQETPNTTAEVEF